MSYSSLEASLLDLEKNGMLRHITEEVDPELEMAAIHLRVYEAGGPALLFEKIKGSTFKAASNIFGTTERCHFLFRHTLPHVSNMVAMRKDPLSVLKKPFSNIKTALLALKALPKKYSAGNFNFREISIADLPLIKHWPKDGGAFVTLPQVYSEDLFNPGWKHSNLGMYRIQLSGNDYQLNQEIGLHYQLHRGIGVHQEAAQRKGEPFKVSIFVGGPPAHTVAAVMPLPEGMSELTFAGILGNRRFRYSYVDGYCISHDADFVITGEIIPNLNKPEGPFGDHLGYYSLQHPFPVLKVHKVFAKPNAIWPFTVVGRPPQEDTGFGNFIHEITGDVLKDEIPGLKELNAVDAAGVHPLLLAIGSERYTPYNPTTRPAEILTIANHILGKGQLSLAKFLFITADNDGSLNTKDIPAYFNYLLKRIDLTRDIHFYTNTTIDTLDYSGSDLNMGSKVVFAAYGKEIRNLVAETPVFLNELKGFHKPQVLLPGIIALQTKAFSSYEDAEKEMQELSEQLKVRNLDDFPLIVICDNSDFLKKTLNNFLWVTFTRCNPSHDIYGVDSFQIHKHWGCKGSLLIDARIKPHHAPPVEKDSEIEKRISPIFEKGGSLFGL
jgi:4-hydroxy-3-polyprenylbenzoate decarboxylase